MSVALRCGNTLLWLSFLVLLASSAFVQSLYPATWWWLIQTGFAILMLASLSLSLIFNTEMPGVLKKSGLVLSVLIVGVLWLFLQSLLPLDNAALSYLFQPLPSGSESPPAWWSVSTGWSLVPEKSLDLMYQELFMLSVFLVTILLVNTRQRLLWLVGLLSVVGLTHAIIGMFTQQAGVFLVPVDQIDGHFSAARGLFINRNHFAAFLVLSSVGSLAFMLRPLLSNARETVIQIASKLMRGWSGIALVFLMILLAALALSQSRAGFFGYLVSCFLCLLFIGTGIFKRRIVLLLLVSLSVIALWFFGSDLLTRLSAGATLGERVLQWKLTWQIILEQPILGFGGNAYSDVFQLYREQEPLRYLVYNQAHNDFLHIWLEQGLIGLMIWLSVIALFAWRLVRNVRVLKSQTLKCLSLAILAVLLATLLQSLVDFHLHIVTIRVYFFCICALAFVMPCLHLKSKRH